MNNKEILSVLLEKNNESDDPIDTEIVEAILSCVILNPLPDDRGRCQEQIMLLISQNCGVEI